MAIGTHKVPGENKNEDKWFKYFSLGQLIACIVIIIIDVLLFRIFSAANIVLAGVFIIMMFSAFAGIVIMGKMPPSKYLLGSGQPLYIILARIVFHKINHKYIFIRNYEQGDKK